VNAERLHVVLAHGGDGKIAAFYNGQFLAIGGENSE
jgi:hypothetical protein